MTENPTERPDVATLSYEQARAELINVVQRLEAGGATLEESLELWDRGEQLAQRCQAWLDGAQAKLDAAKARRPIRRRNGRRLKQVALPASQ